MAAKRVAKSAVNWAAFAERVPPRQSEAYRAFKAHSDTFVAKVHQFPENLPNIDFAYYSTRLSNPAMVTEFEKAYKALAVPYPQDKNKVKAEVDRVEKEEMEKSKNLVADAQETIKISNHILEKLKTVPQPDTMTLEMEAVYFPHPEEPTLWPHTWSYQPWNDPNTKW